MSNVRSASLTPSSRVSLQYRRGRAAAGLTMFLLIWIALWLLNGYFTARAVVGLGSSFGLSWGAGWLAHVVMTLLELSVGFITPYMTGVPRYVLVLLWIIALPFGVFDVGSSTLGLLDTAALIQLTPSTPLIILCTLLAEGIAIAPEPVILWLFIALVRLARER